jgi:hypothetical protein
MDTPMILVSVLDNIKQYIGCIICSRLRDLGREVAILRLYRLNRCQKIESLSRKLMRIQSWNTNINFQFLK